MMEISVSNFLVDQWLGDTYKVEKVFINAIPGRMEAVETGQLDMGLIPEPFASVGELQGLKKVTFLPIFMALFGLGDLSKIILLFSVLIFQVILATRDGVKQIPVEFHHVVMTLHLSRGEKLLKLYLPSALPNLFSALRVGVGISNAVLFFGENYATTYGMGYYIMNNWMMVNYRGMFAGIVVLAIIAAGLIYCFDLLERRFCRWMTYEKRQIY